MFLYQPFFVVKNIQVHHNYKLFMDFEKYVTRIQYSILNPFQFIIPKILCEICILRKVRWCVNKRLPLPTACLDGC